MTTSLIEELKAYCINVLQFDLVGVTDAAPPTGGAHLRRWLESGRHAGMAWMADTAAGRCDPGLFLAGAKSVICVAMSYRDQPEPAELTPREDRVVVARYARRPDYHKVIRSRLVRLGRWLSERHPAARWRPAVDSAPLLEKDLAQRAGLGWIGKNTCLINRRLGSEILLGELVTDVTLPADEPERDHCGTCTACLHACPTRAFPAARQLDATRCISYLTIEHRGEMPPALLPALGAHVFGCDICQAVCPWNRRAAAACAAPLRARPALGDLRLTALECLDEAGWRALVAGTPLRRIDVLRLRRNLAAVRATIHRDGREYGGGATER